MDFAPLKLQINVGARLKAYQNFSIYRNKTLVLVVYCDQMYYRNFGFWLPESHTHPFLNDDSTVTFFGIPPQARDFGF